MNCDQDWNLKIQVLRNIPRKIKCYETFPENQVFRNIPRKPQKFPSLFKSPKIPQSPNKMPAIPNMKTRKTKVKKSPKKNGKVTGKSREQCEREGITWKPSRKYLERALREEEENTKELNMEVFERIFESGIFQEFRSCENLFL